MIITNFVFTPRAGFSMALCLVVLIFTAPVPGETAPPVKPIAPSALDRMIRNSEHRGVLVFMAAWCGPCMHELPTLVRLYERYKDQGLNMVGISVDARGPGAIQPKLARAGVRFPVYWGGDKVIQHYKISAIPLLFFIKDGKVVEKTTGRFFEKDLDEKIQRLLK